MKSSPPQSDSNLHGFTLKDSTAVPDLNLTLHSFLHNQSGARYLHIEADDDNNMFGIGFKTTQQNSTGVAHILEHTVLCGSRKYPVRDPFFSMLRRSLNTFMNALTSSDWTLYPFSTCNRTDFYNLMGVYIDAVFFPLLREVDFRQEGHRLEFASSDDPDTPLEIKGIVYNEMKGAMADPSSLLARRLNRALFPTVTYGCNSGGEPEEIPALSYQELRDFHERYYHPSNSYLCSYGNLPVEKHLEYIHHHALKQFEQMPPHTAIPREKRYSAPQTFRLPYPVDAADDLDQRALVQLGWLTSPIEDREDTTALNVLASLLIGNPSAPLYRDLLDSGLGLNLTPGTGFHDDLRETYFAAGLQGCEPKQSEAVETQILETLTRCSETGFTQQQIDAAIHQLEFSYREVGGDAYPYGLTLLVRLLASWLHNDDPLTPLQTLARYKEIRNTARDTKLFERLIRTYLLNNPHRVSLTLFPDTGLKTRQEQEQLQKLAELKAGLDSQQVQELLVQADNLNTAQESPGDLEALPTLELSDIPRSEQEVDYIQSQIANTPAWYFSQPTNGIAYLTLRFDIESLDSELSPYLPIFCTLLPQLGTAGQSYLVISERITAATGGIRASTQLSEQACTDDFTRSLEIRSKCLYRYQSEMFALIAELLTSVNFDDYERIHQVLNQLRISVENGVPGSGHNYAIRAASASLTPSGHLKESWNGIEQLQLVRRWANTPATELEPLVSKMKQIVAALINRNSLRLMLCAEEDAIAKIQPELKNFLEKLPLSPLNPATSAPSYPSSLAHDGWITSAPVAYVARVFRTVTYSHPEAPGLAVLSRLLRAGYLHLEIRERGGAYGGLVSNDPLSGLFSMVSYRDPHIVRTLQVYRDAAEWAATGNFDQTDIKEAILSCFADIDRPNSPAGRAYREFNCLEQGLTRELRQRFRAGLLTVDRTKLMELAQRFLINGWDESAVAVLGGEELLERENKQLTPALKVERI